MKEKDLSHIQCLIENVGINARLHQNQGKIKKEAEEVMQEIIKLLDMPDDDKKEIKKEIDFQMLDPKEVMNKKIVDIHLHEDRDGEELQLLLEDGKQIEICLHDDGHIHIQSD